MTTPSGSAGGNETHRCRGSLATRSVPSQGGAWRLTNDGGSPTADTSTQPRPNVGPRRSRRSPWLRCGHGGFVSHGRPDHARPPLPRCEQPFLALATVDSPFLEPFPFNA